MSNNLLLDAALKYASRGWYVFPCREKDEGTYWDSKLGKEKHAKIKRPRIAGGLHSASINKEQIEKWWRNYRWENSAIGINCGLSHLLVIDIDNKDGVDGHLTYNNLEIPDKGAWMTSTAGGGTHVIFSDPNELGRTRSNTKQKLDVRGMGGYFIAPPSFIISKDGSKKYYKWIENNGENPAEVTMEIIEKLGMLRKETPTKPKKEYKISRVDEVVKVSKALEKIPMDMCDNYSDWVKVGLALFSMGDDGFFLWKEWSKKSVHYEEGCCENKWETFRPNKVGLGTIFYHAKQGG
jgi:putative DNA primase/helicase